ncbi:MAG: ankyrin repeat domain-containing protein [Alphaproteobacteria bacterium]
MERQLCIFAVQANKIEALKELIKAGSDINILENGGKTALHIAPLYLPKLNNNINIVKELIKAGIDIDLKDKEGFSALDYASFRGNNGIVEELIKAGVDTDKRTSKRITQNNGLSSESKKLLKQRVEIEKKLDKKFDTRIEKAFKEFKESGDFEKSFIENKLYKHIGLDEKNIKLFEEKAEEVKNKEIKLRGFDKFKSIFKGEEGIKFEKALSSIKKEVKDKDEYKILSKERIKHKMNKGDNSRGSKK